MDMTPGRSRDIEALRAEIAELKRQIEALTHPPEVSPEWLLGLQAMPARVMQLLFEACPRTLTRDYILSRMPERPDRYDRAVDAAVKRARRKLGKGCAITEYGLGYRMSKAFHDRLLKRPLEPTP
jgi:DNA-binding response OmpR family regulator